MCRVHATIEEGLIPSEKIARIETIDGSIEEFTVSETQVEDESVIASYIGRQDGSVLVEMPRESASGRWRVWVRDAEVNGSR
jgi:hypothetical protein